MTAYAESSAVLRWLFNEPGGGEVLRHLREVRKVVCSRLTLIECRRASRRALAESRITEAELADVLAALAQGAAHWAIVELTREVAERAAASFPIEPLRTLDAIHLATMSVMRESVADLTILTTDHRIRANGAQLGFTVLPEALPR
jgi:predicted nucleic acid-binding protein